MSGINNQQSSSSSFVNAIIIGGGHAGVNLGCMLSLERPDQDYLILERSGSLLDKWRSSRWEKFNLNTPVKFALLYGQTMEEDGRDPWLLERSIEGELERWDAHITKLGIRHKLHSNVVKVTKDNDTGTFSVQVENTKDKSTTTFTSKNVAVCNGMFDAPSYPKDLAANLPPSIKQHLPAGFKFDDLVDGNVLLVGGAQTGVQLADLLLTHRPNVKVYLCVSAVPGCPRSFQGRELFDWLKEMKFLDMPREALTKMPPEKAKAMRYPKTPITGPFKEISPFSLHRQGVELLGHLDKIEKSDGGDATFHFKDDRASSVQVSYDGYSNFFNAIKKHAGPSAEEEPMAPEWSNLESELLNEPGRLQINSAEEKITNVIWCTGWTHDFSFLDGIQDIDKDMDIPTKAPDVIMSRATSGLFYCGFPWIGTLQSLNIVNFNPDAKCIMENLLK